MASIERKDVMNMVAIMCAGVFSNPASGNVMTQQYQYGRQQLIEQVLWETQSALQSAGINIIDLDGGQ